MEMNSGNFLLSIIVPVYNAAPHLRECVDSILHQTYENLEIILMADGGSTDNSTEICEEYAEKDARIKVLHRPHETLPAARKAGVAAANGEYVAYVDSDDWIDADAYERILESMGDQSPDVLVHGFIREYADKGVVCQYGLPSGYYDENGIAAEIYPHLLEIRFPYQWELLPGYWRANGHDRTRRGPALQVPQLYIYSGVWSKVFKRNILKRSQMAVPDDLTEGEDLVCTVHTLFSAHSVMVTDFAPYHYRFRTDSLARTDHGRPYQEHQLLFRSLHAALSKRPLTGLYRMRLSRYLMDRVLLNRYERFLTGRFSDVLFGSLDGRRVALYGAGRFGQEIYRKTSQVFPNRITLWVDRDYESARMNGLPAEPVQALQSKEYDVVVIALVNEEICEQIKQDLIAMGIDPEKIRYATASPEVLKAVEAVFLDQ
ncbi:glycosyltransferase family A protein [Oscillospiraceae bacterium 50-60]